jgi:hypothetical protein
MYINVGTARFPVIYLLAGRESSGFRATLLVLFIHLSWQNFDIAVLK